MGQFALLFQDRLHNQIFAYLICGDNTISAGVVAICSIDLKFAGAVGQLANLAVCIRVEALAILENASLKLHETTANKKVALQCDR